MGNECMVSRMSVASRSTVLKRRKVLLGSGGYCRLGKPFRIGFLKMASPASEGLCHAASGSLRTSTGIVGHPRNNCDAKRDRGKGRREDSCPLPLRYLPQALRPLPKTERSRYSYISSCMMPEDPIKYLHCSVVLSIFIGKNITKRENEILGIVHQQPLLAALLLVIGKPELVRIA
jgi:hypothetical protein